MSDPKYKDIGHPLTRAMEECSEVIQAGCKIQRFGWNNYNPHDPEKTTNVKRLISEMKDVKEAFTSLEAYLLKEVI